MSGRRQSSEPKPPPGPWARYANCIGLPSSWFFPDKGDSEGSQGNQQVRVVCAACACRRQCMEYAMTPPMEMTGWWGGSSPRERVALRRKQRLERRAAS